MSTTGTIAAVVAVIFPAVVLAKLLRITSGNYTEGVKAKYAERIRAAEPAATARERSEVAHALGGSPRCGGVALTPSPRQRGKSVAIDPYHMCLGLGSGGNRAHQSQSEGSP